MSFWRKTLTYLGLVEDEEFEEYEEVEEPQNVYRGGGPNVRKLHPREMRHEPTAAVRAVSSMSRVSVHIIEPKGFNDAKQIGDKFKQNTPVIMNLQFVDKELAKRLIDFASGLTFGLNGGLQRAADKVFLLVPHNVEVSAEEKLRLQEKGLFNQF